MRAFCTIVTADHMPLALALHRSLCERTDVPLEVLVVDGVPELTDQMSLRLTSLAADPVAAASMGSAGRASVIQQHTLGASIEKLRAVMWG